MKIFIILFWAVTLTTAVQQKAYCYDKNEEFVCISPNGCSLSSQIPWRFCRYGVCCRRATNLYFSKRQITNLVEHNFFRNFNFADQLAAHRYRNFPKFMQNKKVEGDKYNTYLQNNPGTDKTTKKPNIINYQNFKKGHIISQKKEKNNDEHLPKHVQVCRNYTALFGNTKNMTSLKIDQKPLTIDNCQPKLVPLIIGGTQSINDEFPHMIALGYDKYGRIDYLCGGSLISDKYSLTAAHCLKTRWSVYEQKLYIAHNVIFYEGEPILVHAGSIDLESGKKLAIENMIKHPGYKSTSGDHDIGIVKTKLELKLSYSVKPACLPLKETKAQYPESAVFATGWGKLGSDSLSSNILMRVPLKVIDNHICEEYYQKEIKSKALKEGVGQKLICAKGLKFKEQDTCQGDSGGPLQALLPRSSCTWQIVGITSFGKLCGSGFPAIYTRIAPYVPWIESIVWPD